MNRQIFLVTSLTLCLASLTSQAESQVEALRLRIDQMEKSHQQSTQALTDEMANLKMQMAIPESANKSYSGLGVAASKVYNNKSKLSIGGYGEIVFTDNKKGLDTTDAYRLVPYIGYRFSDDLIFNAEIEFEHGGANAAGAGTGEAIIEFAYIDFLHSEGFKLRAGHVLVPVGLINMLHEPTVFPTINRPEVEKNIIPSTWHENGILAYGDLGPVHYYAGLVNSGNADSFSKSSWIRKTRQKGAQATAEDFSYVVRLDSNSLDNLSFGTSYYTGNTAQGDDTLGDANVKLAEIHGTYQAHDFEFLGLYATGQLSDVDKIRNLVTGNPVMGEKVSGYYAMISYDIMKWIRPSSSSKLPLFAAHESYNLHEEVEEGQTIDESLEKTITTVGLNYKPHSNVVVKANYQFRSNVAKTESDRFELGLGWIF